MWKAVKRSVQAPMRLLGILNQIRILLEEQNDLLREIHLATRGTPALTAKRRAPDPTIPFRKRTAADVWIRPPMTVEAAEAHERARRESAASSVVDSGETSGPDAPGSGIDPNRSSGATTADAESWPA